MRSLFVAAVSLLLPLVSTLPHPMVDSVEILEYNRGAAYTKFSIPCPAAVSCSIADESLVFEAQINYTAGSGSDLIVNGHNLGLNKDSHSATWPRPLFANSSSGHQYAVVWTAVTSAGKVDVEAPPVRVATALTHLTFFIHNIDAQPTQGLGFTVGSQPGVGLPLRSLALHRGPGMQDVGIDFSNYNDFTQESKYGDDAMSFVSDHVGFNLTEELDSLQLLEVQAQSLRSQIATKKQAISTHLREHRVHASLRHLLQECDGLVCAARVIAQRICDKVSVLAEHDFRYTQVQDPRLQNTIALHNDDEKPQQTSRNCTRSKHPSVPSKHANGTAQGFNLPLTLTKAPSLHNYHLTDATDTTNPLVRAMAIIASVLGITALCSYIRKKCMSMRKRVERAADREERRNARAYRRAARRAQMRRRWDNFVSAINCFSSPPDPRVEDYEEKRALILQDAFLEGLDDLDQAEKGEIMEAEIRELRHAHEIVASLVRVDENRYDLVTPVNDPPPPLVPLPYTPATRSRASTGTLPPYNSESLPDYSSRPQTLAGSSTGDSLVNGSSRYTPSTSDEGGRRYVPSSTSSGGRTRYTPTSSILEVSPRVSEETLRTRRSKDTQYS